MERVAPIFENFQSFLQILRAIKMQEQFFFYYRLKKNKFNILRLYYVSISFVSNYSCISAYIYIYVYFLEHICISIETSGRKYKVNGYKGYRDQ